MKYDGIRTIICVHKLCKVLGHVSYKIVGFMSFNFIEYVEFMQEKVKRMALKP